MTTQHQIARDLAKHLNEKFISAMSDYLSLCRIAGVEHSESSAELMAMVIHIAAVLAAEEYDIPPNEFARVLTLEYVRAKRTSTKGGQ